MQNPYRLNILVLTIVLAAWVWGLGLVVFALRWNAFERPGTPVRELFPYGEMRIGVDASYPPFAVVTTDDLFGLDIDLGKMLAERLGIPVRFVNMGFDGLYDSIRADQVDMVISALLIDPTRTAEVRYTQPYFNAGLVLVSNSANQFENMLAIPGHSLAYEFGSEADAQARLWGRRVQPFERQPYELPQYALDALRLDLADAVLVDSVSFRLYMREHRDWSVQAAPVTDAPYAIAIRIDRYEMWEAVNRALQALKDDGTLDEMIRRWL
jgi:polar amino acid transport system substrate-binding protein